MTTTDGPERGLSSILYHTPDVFLMQVSRGSEPVETNPWDEFEDEPANVTDINKVRRMQVQSRNETRLKHRHEVELSAYDLGIQARYGTTKKSKENPFVIGTPEWAEWLDGFEGEDTMW